MHPAGTSCTQPDPPLLLSRKRQKSQLPVALKNEECVWETPQKILGFKQLPNITADLWHVGQTLTPLHRPQPLLLFLFLLSMSALQSLFAETLPDWVKLTQLRLTAAVAAKSPVANSVSADFCMALCFKLSAVQLVRTFKSQGPWSCSAQQSWAPRNSEDQSFI